MSSIDAVYDEGVFRPVTPVSLPDRCRVRITVEPIEVAPGSDEDAARKAVYEVLSHRHRSGRSDIAARHDEHQP